MDSEIATMQLLLLLLAIGLQLAVPAADAFLDTCPIDRDLQIDNAAVVDVLETFYNDLVFVRASTRSKRARHYSKLSEELNKGYQEEPEPRPSESAFQSLDVVIYLLLTGRLRTADLELNMISAQEGNEGPAATYLYYLKAEVNRLLGFNADACSAVLAAYLERHKSAGISMNELARLDGLLALQKVSFLNQDIDKRYGLRRSPDSRLLSLLHLMVGGETRPLQELRSAVTTRLYETSPPIGSFASGSSADASGEEVQRVDSELDDFSGHTVAHSSAEGILCEFALKMQLLGVSSRDETPPANYSEVIEQLRQIDPQFAQELYDNVVSHIETDIQRAQTEAYSYWARVRGQPHTDSMEIREIFAWYFSVELYRRSADSCNLWNLDDLYEDLHNLEFSRRTYPGVSLARIVELQGKVVFLWLRCFHERLKLAYGLTGNEDAQQLRARRARYGKDRRRLLPESALL